MQDPAGLKRVGASLLLELLLPRFWLLGGLPRGALTGERTGSFPEPAFLERVGETTAAAAAMRERPDVPCKSTLFTREFGGRAYVWSCSATSRGTILLRASAAIMTSSRASSEVLLCTKLVLGTFLLPLVDWWGFCDRASSWLESVRVLSVSDSFLEPSVSDALSVFSLSKPSVRGEALFLLFFGLTSAVMAGTGLRALLLIFSALCGKDEYSSDSRGRAKR